MWDAMLLRDSSGSIHGSRKIDPNWPAFGA